MLAAIATYRDLNGDAPRVEVAGIRFLDGVPVEIEAGTVPLSLLRRLEGNPWFEIVIEEAQEAEEVETVAEAAPKRRGRPPKAAEEKEAGE